MSFKVRYTREAKDDLKRLYSFLLEHDLQLARKALDAITRSMEFLQDFPFSCRKATKENPFLREILIPFVASGYVALFEVESKEILTVLAIRHQREEDYY